LKQGRSGNSRPGSQDSARRLNVRHRHRWINDSGYRRCSWR